MANVKNQAKCIYCIQYSSVKTPTLASNITESNTVIKFLYRLFCKYGNKYN